MPNPHGTLKYKVTLRNGNTFVVDADSMLDAKRIVRARLRSLGKHATTPQARAAYAEQSVESGMQAERQV
jgi:hypothetical protein